LARSRREETDWSNGRSCSIVMKTELVVGGDGGRTVE
jgi:hypothetical protein